MFARPLQIISLAALLAVLNGCATSGYRVFPETLLLTPACVTELSQWESRVARAQAFEAQYPVVPGYPYLRADRFLASLASPDLTASQRAEWLNDSWQYARTAWQLEARILGVDRLALSTLYPCAGDAIVRLQQDPDAFAAMVQKVRVPDDYSTAAQVIGLAPLWSPIVRMQIDQLFDDLLADFGTPVVGMPAMTYQPLTRVLMDDATLNRLMAGAYQRSALGIPRLNASEKSRLFANYAPTWTVETRSPADQPGTPIRRHDGHLGFREEPVVYRHLSYTRDGDTVLPQLNYLMWFPRRPATGSLDILAGELDGLFWRVTLGPDGRPLWFDSIHPCGCYHLWFPVAGRTRLNSAATDSGSEVASPATLPATLRQAHLTLASGSHYLIDVDAQVRVVVSSTRYALEDYDALRQPSAPGIRLFGPEGLIAGTERPERFLLWPMGVPSAGGMRQWGHHATAFLSRRHFDDPDLTRRVFISEVP